MSILMVIIVPFYIVKNNSEPQNIDVEQIDLGRKKSLKKMASLILPSL